MAEAGAVAEGQRLEREGQLAKVLTETVALSALYSNVEMASNCPFFLLLPGFSI